MRGVLCAHVVEISFTHGTREVLPPWKRPATTRSANSACSCCRCAVLYTVADPERTRTIPIALSRRPAAPFNSLLTESLRDSANNPLNYVNLDIMD